MHFTARDRKGARWLFDVSGSVTSHRAGLKRADTLWKALDKAAVIHEVTKARLVLTTDASVRGSAGAEALKAVTGPGKPIHAVIEMLTPSGLE